MCCLIQGFYLSYIWFLGLQRNDLGYEPCINGISWKSIRKPNYLVFRFPVQPCRGYKLRRLLHTINNLLSPEWLVYYLLLYRNLSEGIILSVKFIILSHCYKQSILVILRVIFTLPLTPSTLNIFVFVLSYYIFRFHSCIQRYNYNVIVMTLWLGEWYW